MAYYSKKELEKWQKWKAEEEKVLRELGVEEDVINELHDYDKELFNKRRSFKENEQITEETYFLIKESNNETPYENLEGLLNCIDDEMIHMIFENMNSTLYQICDLRVQGYSIKEISVIMNIKEKTIYQKIARFEKFFFKVVEK